MSNVMYNSHGAESLGDASHAFKDLDPSNISKNAKEKEKNEYHFHNTIQVLEDKLQGFWKEQNKGMSEGRQNPLSSGTNATFRKLYTDMIYPYFYNLFSIIIMFTIVPLLVSIKVENTSIQSGLFYTSIVIFLILFSSVIFDAYVIYRSRKFVIEAVTRRFYNIWKKSWRVFEVSSVVVALILYFNVFAYYKTSLFDFNITSNFLKKIISYIDFDKMYQFTILVTIVYFFIYIVITIALSRKAAKEQRASIIEARSNAQHNADVAKDLMNNKLGEEN